MSETHLETDVSVEIFLLADDRTDMSGFEDATQSGGGSTPSATRGAQREAVRECSALGLMARLSGPGPPRRCQPGRPSAALAPQQTAAGSRARAGPAVAKRGRQQAEPSRSRRAQPRARSKRSAQHAVIAGLPSKDPEGATTELKENVPRGYAGAGRRWLRTRRTRPAVETSAPRSRERSDQTLGEPEGANSKTEVHEVVANADRTIEGGGDETAVRPRRPAVARMGRRGAAPEQLSARRPRTVHRVALGQRPGAQRSHRSRAAPGRRPVRRVAPEVRTLRARLGHNATRPSW